MVYQMEIPYIYFLFFLFCPQSNQMRGISPSKIPGLVRAAYLFAFFV